MMLSSLVDTSRRRCLPFLAALPLLSVILLAGAWAPAVVAADSPWSDDPCMATLSEGERAQGLGAVTDEATCIDAGGGVGCRAPEDPCHLCRRDAQVDGPYPVCAELYEQIHHPEPFTFRVYRALDSATLSGPLGDAGKSLENTNTASAGGVLGYLHTEVIPDFVVENSTERHHGIDAVAVFEVKLLGVPAARLLASSDPPSDAPLFGPFMAMDAGQATPPAARRQITDWGAYVGIQDQGGNPRHAYRGDWHSFVGYCPLTPWIDGYDGRRQKPRPCPTEPDLAELCDASTAKPDGTSLCQYTYSYLGYVPLDDLVGITSTSDPRCQSGGTPRPCADYADFRKNGLDGGVEYSPGPSHDLDCSSAGDAAESGLPFWQGRCDREKARQRIRALESYENLIR